MFWFFNAVEKRDKKGVYHYSTEFNCECFRNCLTLGVGSVAKNVNDDLFIRAESFHRNSSERKVLVVFNTI